MPRLKNIKPPTQKRVDGAIYNFEKRNEHNAALTLLKKCKERMHRIAVYIKDTHTGTTTVKYVQPVKH